MTHTRKKANAKTSRKMILRRMKKLTAVINQHGWNYYNLLKENWNKTDWSEARGRLCSQTHNKTCFDQLPALLNRLMKGLSASASRQ